MPHQCTTCGHVFADGSKEMLSGCPDCGGTKFQFHPEGTDIPDSPPGDAEPPERPSADDSVAGAVGNAAATVRNFVGSGPASGGTDTPGPDGTETPASSDSTGEASSPPEAVASDAGIAGADTEPTDATVDPTDTAVDPADTTADADAEESVAGVALQDRSDRSDPASVDQEDAAQASARSEVVSPDELPETDAATPPVEDGQVVQEPDDDRPDLSELRAELNDQFESIKVLEPGQYELNLMELYDREEYIIALQEDGKYSIQVPDRWQD